MYLARRADMAKMIAPDPETIQGAPPDSPMALLPADPVLSSSLAEVALTQALQMVATDQQHALPSSRFADPKASQSPRHRRSLGSRQDVGPEDPRPWQKAWQRQSLGSRQDEGFARPKGWQSPGQRQSRGSRQGEEEDLPHTIQRPHEMAVPDQASMIDFCRCKIACNLCVWNKGKTKTSLHYQAL